MRYRLKYLIVFLCVALIALSIWFVYPKRVNQTFEGVSYQLGDQENNADKVTIKVDGKLKKRLFKNQIFEGTIAIDDELLPPNVEETLKIELDSIWGGGWIQYWEPFMNVYTYGILIINNDFSELTILKQESDVSEEEDHENPQSSVEGDQRKRSSWSGEDGRVISAPADDRTEALKITNMLMEDHLQRPLE